LVLFFKKERSFFLGHVVMTLAALFDGDFQHFFAESLKHNPLWLFVHIPKTAGSSLNGELVPILSPSYHIFVDYSEADQRPFNEKLDSSVERFIEASRSKRYFYCTGHILSHHVARIVEGVRDVMPITLLRDPVARVVSDYRYQCSPMHPGHEQFFARHPTIDSYLDQPGEQNKASVHLLPRALIDAGSPAPCVEHLLATYGVIGIQEFYALSLRLITTLAGSPKQPKIFKRVNTPTENSGIQLTAAQERRIRDDNALDIAIYENIAARFGAISEKLEAYLDVVDPLSP